MTGFAKVYLPLAITLGLFGCKSDRGFVGNEPPEYGLGAARPLEALEQVDRIVQVATPTVDVLLWTIDNSGSMEFAQTALVASFQEFMNYFLDSGLDYHVGVTSTDLIGSYNGSKGKLRTFEDLRFIDNDTPDPIPVFQAMAGMGIGGSGTEQGTGATFQALEIERDEANVGFYRDDAAVHTIVISDEPDLTRTQIITQPEFVAWYSSLKDEVDMRTFSAIVDPADGGEYIAISEEIGGITWDIFTDDWDQVLERLGVQAAGFKREFYLSQRPVMGSIVVTVEDVTGAELSATEIPLEGTTVVERAWTYDPTRNSITFVDYVPNPLATVVLTYTLLSSEA